MTAFVLLPFISMIPIDFKITYTCVCLLFLVTITNICELTSATSKYYFHGCHTHLLMKSSYAVSFVFPHGHPVAQHYRQRRT